MDFFNGLYGRVKMFTPKNLKYSIECSLFITVQYHVNKTLKVLLNSVQMKSIVHVIGLLDN